MLSELFFFSVAISFASLSVNGKGDDGELNFPDAGEFDIELTSDSIPGNGGGGGAGGGKDVGVLGLSILVDLETVDVSEFKKDGMGGGGGGGGGGGKDETADFSSTACKNSGNGGGGGDNKFIFMNDGRGGGGGGGGVCSRVLFLSVSKGINEVSDCILSSNAEK